MATTAAFTLAAAMAAIVSVRSMASKRDANKRASRAALLAQRQDVAARQKAIFDGAMDTIITLDPAGSIETVNAAGLQLFGYSEADLLGRDIALLLDLSPALADKAHHGRTRELTARPKSGPPIPVDVTLGAIPLADGAHAIAIIRNTAERRRIEDLKDSFIATVSHELRTPLTSIVGSLGLLRGGAGGQLPARASRLVEIAESNSVRLVRLINDILDIEKLSSGAETQETRPLPAGRLTRSACDAMAGLAHEREVYVVADPVAADLWVQGDFDRLMQVTTNLLSNAVKVSPAGGLVQVTAEERGPDIRIAVTDEGPGVPLDFRDKIFERFAQADDSDRRRVDGTGLGLSIVREIVERHGGRVGFESEPGAGACFFFDIRRIDPPADFDLAETRPRPRLLICEDDFLITEVLTHLVDELGYDTDAVSTAAEARHALHIGDYDAMLLDIRLPDSDGITLMQALRAAPNTARLPIIIMSGSLEHKALARALGIVDWLNKPLDVAHLKRAIDAALLDAAPASLILHIDDDRDIFEVTKARLGGIGDVIGAASCAEAQEQIARRMPDLVILDIGVDDGKAQGLLEDLGRQPGGGPPVILYSARDIAHDPGPPVVSVLVKSRADSIQLARVVRRVMQGGPA